MLKQYTLTQSTGPTTTIQNDSGAQNGPTDVELQPGTGGATNEDDASLTDVVAALASAVLALTFVLLVVCIIRAIKKRRRQRQGQRLNQPVVHTISPAAFTANIGAYSEQIPTAGRISWERVDNSTRPPSSSQLVRSNQTLEASRLYPDFHDLQLPGPSEPSTSRGGASSLSALSIEAMSPQNVSHGWNSGGAGAVARMPSFSPSYLEIMHVDAELHHIPQSSQHLNFSVSEADYTRSSSQGLVSPSLLQSSDMCTLHQQHNSTHIPHNDCSSTDYCNDKAGACIGACAAAEIESTDLQAGFERSTGHLQRPSQ